ncbi:MAG: hypothetical protein WCO84_08510 [bacterium]
MTTHVLIVDQHPGSDLASLGYETFQSGDVTSFILELGSKEGLETTMDHYMKVEGTDPTPTYRFVRAGRIDVLIVNPRIVRIGPDKGWGSRTTIPVGPDSMVKSVKVSIRTLIQMDGAADPNLVSGYDETIELDMETYNLEMSRKIDYVYGEDGRVKEMVPRYTEYLFHGRAKQEPVKPITINDLPSV